MTGWWALAAVLVVVVLLRRRYTTATVRGNSMSPTFRDGARVVATRAAGYRVGDVVVFRADRAVRSDPGCRIKRVAATEGEPAPEWLELPGTAVVPPGCVVVAGDNPHSQDSRQLGFIPLTAVVGRVTRVLPSSRAPSRFSPR